MERHEVAAKAQRLHRKCMRLVGEVQSMSSGDEIEAARPRLSRAFRLAWESAHLLLPYKDFEPQRSELCLIAAILAMDLKKLVEADLMITQGLLGNINEKARDAFQQLRLKNLQMEGIA